MKNGDRVDDEGKDVGYGLGGDEQRWLVVGCRDGREFFVQESFNSQALVWENSKSGDAFALYSVPCQFVEKVPPQSVHVHKFLFLRNNRRVDWQFPVYKQHAFCAKGQHVRWTSTGQKI